MGLILGRFRKKKTTLDVLESIDKEIKSIEEFRRTTEQTHKRIVGRFVIISVGFYLVTAALFYFYYFPANFYDQLFYVIPLILAPVIILLVKRVLTWYYQRKISRKQNKLVTLRNEKKEILEKVMETETYKVAKTILDKFAPPEQNNRRITEVATPMQPISQVPINTGLRQRAISPNQQSVLRTPVRPVPVDRPTTAIVKSAVGNVPSRSVPPPPGSQLPMPRAVLPRERSIFDRMVDYLVGDGPSNRYALICKNCYSHNGMAFRDEVEYFSFRCCYCHTFNPALKKRPLAPKFEYKLKAPHDEKSDSESERNSPSDTDSDSDDGVVVLQSAQEVANSHEESPVVAKDEHESSERNENKIEEIVNDDKETASQDAINAEVKD
ncbi:hypothetical protein RN001_000432 [Aquatica leii]|uniref:Endoplasmic reticulum junction formation protein lunapark n=1 Tax=Aquatica leii TaxID=1421715 RepID=A0AAN7SC81_9COLE|nr:hypothetical protein RN001_000432 [Aquatica leii]